MSANLSVQVRFRLTPADHALCETAATAENLTLSEWVRQTLIEQAEKQTKVRVGLRGGRVRVNHDPDDDALAPKPELPTVRRFGEGY